MYYTGARIGEVLALTYSDLEEFENDGWRRSTESTEKATEECLRGLRINIRKSYNSNFKITKSPKNKKSRKIPVPPSLKELLLEDQANHKQKGGDMDDRIFPMEYGSTLYIIDKICQKLEIRHIRPHDFRHTYISNLINANVPLPIIEKVSGDTQDTILNTYSHMFENDEIIILQVMSQL